MHTLFSLIFGDPSLILESILEVLMKKGVHEIESVPCNILNGRKNLSAQNWFIFWQPKGAKSNQYFLFLALQRLQQNNDTIF